MKTDYECQFHVNFGNDTSSYMALLEILSEADFWTAAKFLESFNPKNFS